MLTKKYLKVKIKDNWRKVVIVRANKFYYTYYDDAKILQSIFEYKMNEREELKFEAKDIKTVINKLNNLSISVLEINKNDKITEHNTKPNNYQKYLDESYNRNTKGR